MEILIKENQKVEVKYKGFSILTDQPTQAGGDNSAPSPFDLFMASIGACAGFYVKSFCVQRELPLEGIRLEQKMHRDPEKRMITQVEINIFLPDGFPEKYRAPLIKAAEACSVKKHISSAPEFLVNTVID
ncbi:MAG: OsmC family protein [Bacteroidales bacterium]